jgi:hypothetical protein
MFQFSGISAASSSARTRRGAATSKIDLGDGRLSSE